MRNLYMCYAEKFGISRANFELRKSRKFIHVLSRSQNMVLEGNTSRAYTQHTLAIYVCMFV